MVKALIENVDKSDRRRLDAQRFLLAAVLLFVMAASFLWRDLELGAQYLLGVLAFAATMASLAEQPAWLRLAGPIALIACALGGGLWFATNQTFPLVVGLCLTLAGAVVAAGLGYQRARRSGDTRRAMVLAHSLGLALLATSWAFYVRFLVEGVAEELVARRLFLTLAWLLVGVFTTVVGHRRRDQAAVQVGYVFSVVALGKACLYDTTHLYGILRITTLSLAG